MAVMVVPAMFAVVMALTARPVYAYSKEVRCGTSITSGRMMGASINTNGDSTQIQLAKGGIAIACGGTLTAGDTGLTLVKGSLPSGSQYRECACACVMQQLCPASGFISRISPDRQDD